MEGINDMEGLLYGSSKVHAGARRNHSNIGSDRILNVLVAYFQKLFEQRFEKCPNKVSVMLENLTDETCERLNLALNDAIPVNGVFIGILQYSKRLMRTRFQKVFWDCLTNHATPFCIFCSLVINIPPMALK